MVENSLSGTDIVILAGGLGTRIKPVLGDVPKLLAPIEDRTYLDYLFDWLEGFGARRVILSLGHLADQVIDYIQAHPHATIIVETVVERAPLGTAGALRLVRPHVKSEISLVMNGDSWIGCDLALFAATHRAGGADASILCVRVEDAGRYGLVDVDPKGRIRAFHEKQPNAGPGLINAGVYAFSKAAWDTLSEVEGPSLERDFFQTRPPSTLAAYDAGNVPFIDIGTPESLARAAQIIGGKGADLGDS